MAATHTIKSQILCLKNKKIVEKLAIFCQISTNLFQKFIYKESTGVKPVLLRISITYTTRECSP